MAASAWKAEKLQRVNTGSAFPDSQSRMYRKMPSTLSVCNYEVSRTVMVLARLAAVRVGRCVFEK
jgi:hypothetical protein